MISRSVAVVLAFVMLLPVLTGCAAQEEGAPLYSEVEDLEEQNRSLEQQVNELEKENQMLESKLRKREARMEKLMARNQEIARKLKQEVPRSEVRQQEGQVILTLKERILFAYGSVSITEEGKNRLQKIAGILKQHPNREIRVIGHTDTHPIQTQRFPSNWELGSQRAINVLKYLVYNQGVSRKRIGATSFGQFRPLVPNTTSENRARNRRVEIVLLPPERATKPINQGSS